MLDDVVPDFPSSSDESEPHSDPAETAEVAESMQRDGAPISGRKGCVHSFVQKPGPDFEIIRHPVDTTESTCMFVRDSGRESVPA